MWSRTQTLLPYEAIIGSARAAALALAMQLILCANFVACALAAIAVACAVASLLALLVGCGWALGATEAALACLTPALVTAPAALVVRAYCLSGARRRGQRAAEAFVRAGAPVISGCFAMALGLAPLLACQHEEARKFAIAISMLAACIGLWIGLFLPALFGQCGDWVSTMDHPPRSLRWVWERWLLGQRGEWISPSGATPGSARWVWERWRLRDFTSPEEDQGEALSGVPASARRLTLSARRPISSRRPSSSAGRATPGSRGSRKRSSSLAPGGTVAAEAAVAVASSVAKREGLPRADSLLSGAASELPATSKPSAPPTRRTNLLLSGTSLLARVQAHAEARRASAAASSDSCEHRGGGDGGRRSVALARSFPSEPPGSGRGSGRRPPSARRLSLMGDELNPSAREARRASLAAQTPEDAIDNERLVSALAQDLLGETPMAAQLAEVYGAHSRALLEA